MDDPTAAWNYQAQNRCAGADQLRPRRANPNLNSGCCNAPVPHKGYSNNHSAQVEGDRRYWNGLAFQWFYTFSHAMTTSDTGGYNSGSNNINSSGSGTLFFDRQSQS